MLIVQFDYVDFNTGLIHEGLGWWFTIPRGWQTAPIDIRYAIITPGEYYHWILEDFLEYQNSLGYTVESFYDNTLVMSPALTVPSISYETPNSWAEGSAITPLPPTNTGGASTDWTIQGTPLPTGLSINPTTGIISGVPLSTPHFSYDSPNLLAENYAITPFAPSNIGGPSSDWVVVDTLPTGLNINPTTGVISGTPTVVQGVFSYTVRATNAAGFYEAEVFIGVESSLPVISYANDELSLIQDSGMTPIAPTNTGGASTDWTIQGTALPTGLVIAPTTGVISGTPTVVQDAVEFTIRATNVQGYDEIIISVDVAPSVPSISYSASPLSLTQHLAMTPASPSNTGGVSTNWVAIDTLPTGMVIDPSTGVLSGVCTVVQTSDSYTIRATNITGYGETEVDVTVSSAAPSLYWADSFWSDGYFAQNYYPGYTAQSIVTLYWASGYWTGGYYAQNLYPGYIAQGPVSGAPTISYPAIAEQTVGAPMDVVLPNVSGEITSYADTSALGSKLADYGLLVSEVNGGISGTPTIYTGGSAVTFAITAYGPGGNDSDDVDIDIVLAPITPPSVTYPAIPELHVATAMAPITPTVNDGSGPITSYSDESAAGFKLVDHGLAVDTSTGEISGTPTVETSIGQTFSIRTLGGGGQDDDVIIISIQPAGSYNSLRWDTIYPPIPTEVTDEVNATYGSGQNTLTTSGQTYVQTGHDSVIVPGVPERGSLVYAGVKTYADGGRTNYIEVAAGAKTEKYICSQADTEYILLGDVTFPGAGFDLLADGITLNLNGFKVTYQTVGPEPIPGHTVNEVATVDSTFFNDPDGLPLWEEGEGSFGVYSTEILDAPILTGEINVLQVRWLTGVEAGNVYGCAGGWTQSDGTTKYAMYWYPYNCSINDNGEYYNTCWWSSGTAPSPGDTFEVYYGVMTRGVYIRDDDAQIINGAVEGGTGWGFGTPHDGSGCSAIVAYGGPGRLLLGLYVSWRAHNSEGYSGTYTEPEIAYCTFHDHGTVVMNRHKHKNAIVALGGHVHHNRIINARNQGISLNRAGILEYNEITISCYDTNSSCVNMNGGSSINDTWGTTCRFNNMYAIGGMPVGMNIFPNAQSTDEERCSGNTVYGNWIEVMTTRVSNDASSRFDKTPNWGTGACISNRWGTAVGRALGNSIYQNTMIAYANTEYDGEGAITILSTMRVLWQGGLGSATEEMYYRNVLAGINLDDDTEVEVIGATNAGEDAHNVIVKDCKIIYSKHGSRSNNTYVQSTIYPQLVQDCEFIRYGADPEAAHGCDRLDNGPSIIDYVNCNWGTQARRFRSYFHWVHNPWVRFQVGNNLTVTVEDNLGNPIADALVTVSDKDGSTEPEWRANGVTNLSGQVVLPVVWIRYYGITGVEGENVEYLNDMTLTATSGALNGSEVVTMSGEQAATVVVE